MTDRQFYLAWSEIPNYTDPDAYISDLALSSMWGDDPESEIPTERINYLGRLWDVYHMSVKDICKAANLTQAALATRFGIPKRTVEDWCRGVAKCAPYIRLMMCECLGLIEK